MSCAEEDMAFNPLDMLGQVPQQVGNIAECQDRCASVSGCAHYSYWVPQRVCHLQDSHAVRSSLKSPGFIAGPPTCDVDGLRDLAKGDVRPLAVQPLEQGAGREGGLSRTEAQPPKLLFGAVAMPMQKKFARQAWRGVQEGVHTAVGRVGLGTLTAALTALCALGLASLAAAGILLQRRWRSQVGDLERQILPVDSSDSDDGCPAGFTDRGAAAPSSANTYVLVGGAGFTR